jgi:hypothetical protein
MATNAFRATLPDDTPIGLCYEPTLALANHSCTPNAYIMFNGRTISLITLSPIQKYEEIFISYVDFTQSRDLRRAELRQRYFFQCECEKCKDDLSPYEIFLRTQKTGEDGGLDGFIKPDKLRTHAKNSINLLTTCPDLRNEIRAASEKIYSLLLLCS